MTCCSDLYLNPGSDLLLRSLVLDDAGPVDGTGFVASVFDVSGDLTGAVSADIHAASPLECDLALTWQSGWPLTATKLGSFRYAMISGETEIGSWPVRVFVNAAEDLVEVARGSDLEVEIDWPDDRLGLDMSGDTLTVINASASLSGIVTAEIVDAASRKVRWKIEGSLSMALGDLGTFQLQRATGGLHRRTTNKIRVICK